MRSRLPFRTLQPTFFAGLLDDPVLYLRARPTGRALLFDCGQIHHLAKRVLRSVDALFISHAHMDHFMGFDSFIRNNHAAPRTYDIYGPPGIAAKAARKLAGYDWNLCEPSWCTLRVHDVHPDRIATCLFPGPEGFPCRPQGETARSDRTIFRSDHLAVATEACDHLIPSLAFRVTELPLFLVDEAKIASAGLVRGDWLRQLKKMFYGGMLDRGSLTVLRQEGDRIEESIMTDCRALYETIRGEALTAAIGYLTDVGFSGENLARIEALLAGVDLLVCECSFLADDREKARTSRHLCTTDLNLIIDRLRPRYVLPMHLSKCYAERSRNVYDELEVPDGVTLLRLPAHVTPRPLLPAEIPTLL